MTLERILEPEVMDSDQEAKEYNNMDHSNVNQLFVSDLLAFLQQNDRFARVLNPSDEEDASGDWPEVLDILDVGTGTALIPVELCESKGDNVRVMAIDMAVSMLELARYNIEANSFNDIIQLAQIDAKAMIFESNMFDVVMSNSIIHHIPDPFGCVEEMVRVARPGAGIFVRDLVRPDDLATLDALVETYAGNESEYSRKLFRDSLHAALSLEEVQEMVEKVGFPKESVILSSDRHWTWAAFQAV